MDFSICIFFRLFGSPSHSLMCHPESHIQTVRGSQGYAWVRINKLTTKFVDVSLWILQKWPQCKPYTFHSTSFQNCLAIKMSWPFPNYFLALGFVLEEWCSLRFWCFREIPMQHAFMGRFLWKLDLLFSHFELSESRSRDLAAILDFSENAISGHIEGLWLPGNNSYVAKLHSS